MLSLLIEGIWLLYLSLLFRFNFEWILLMGGTIFSLSVSLYCNWGCWWVEYTLVWCNELIEDVDVGLGVIAAAGIGVVCLEGTLFVTDVVTGGTLFDEVLFE